MSRPLDRMIGAWLGLAVLLQAVLLAAEGSLSYGQIAQLLTGGLCLTLLVMSLWQWRIHLNSHTDMVLIMFASGGLGMLLGMPETKTHSMDFIAWWRMCGGMIVLGLAPAIAFSRCLRAARREGRLLWSLSIDVTAMLAGMWLASRAKTEHGEWMALTRHVSMLGGMTFGMIAGMWIRSGLASWPLPSISGKRLNSLNMRR
ncbi:MAG TPA: hypothetical protein VN633_13220 [Bryobacteraceae bacterium]|nr:hypothetical protein [Bryobacteraceae bacterium]